MKYKIFGLSPGINIDGGFPSIKPPEIPPPPPEPTYDISPSTTSVNEGSSVTWTVTTTNFGTGTLYWTNSGTTSSGDFDDGTNSGSISIVDNTGTLTKTLSNDVTTEGSQTIIIQLRTGSIGGTIVDTSVTVTVADTSTAPTYDISPSTTSVNEGSSVTWTVTTTNFGTGTLYWTNSGTTTSGDFDDGTNSGSISIVNDSGTLTKALSSDYSTEGSETIIIELRTGSTGGTIVATSDTVTVADTSVALPFGDGRYFKWEILDIRGPGTLAATGIQASELILGRYNPTTQYHIDKFSYAGATASQPTGTTLPTETPAKLVDGINGTKWFTATANPTAIIDFGSVKSANAFSYITGNDRTERDPVRWRLYTSPDGNIWTLVHDQSGSSVSITTSRLANTQVFFF